MIERRKLRAPKSWMTMRVFSTGSHVPGHWNTEVLVLSPEQYEADLREAFDAGNELGVEYQSRTSFEHWMQGRKI